MAPRHVLLHYSAPSLAGGVETLVGDFATLASNHNRSLLIVAGKGTSETKPGIRYVHVPLLAADHPDIAAVSHGDLGRIDLAVVDDLASRIASALDQIIEGGDIVHLHNVMTNCFNLPLLVALHRVVAGRADARFLAWCHDLVWNSDAAALYDFATDPYRLAVHRWPRVAYITTSADRRTALSERLSMAPEEVHLLDPHIDIGRVLDLTTHVREMVAANGWLGADVCLLYPCRSAPRKDIKEAIEVARCIKACGHTIRMLVTGFASPHRPAESLRYLDEVAQHIAAAGMSEDIVLASQRNLTRRDIASLYRVADGILSTSRDEGLALMLIEAGMTGVPAIARSTAAGVLPPSGALTLFAPDARPPEIAAIVMDAVKARRERKELLRRFMGGEHHLVHLERIANAISAVGSAELDHSDQTG